MQVAPFTHKGSSRQIRVRWRIQKSALAFLKKLAVWTLQCLREVLSLMAENPHDGSWASWKTIPLEMMEQTTVLPSHFSHQQYELFTAHNHAWSLTSISWHSISWLSSMSLLSYCIIRCSLDCWQCHSLLKISTQINLQHILLYVSTSEVWRGLLFRSGASPTCRFRVSQRAS